MSIQTINNEIEKISLSKEQRITVNNHFDKVKKIIEKLGYANVQKQGSFGRGTVITGQESDGFDLDIAVVVSNDNVWAANQLNQQLCLALTREYSGLTQNVSIGAKAVKVKVRDNFTIDVTQIYKNNDTELVFNSHTMKFETSYALALRNIFRNKNANSKNNALRDLAKIYKHVRDSIEKSNIKSLALEILLYNAFNIDKNLDYGNSLFEALKNVEVAFRAKINNNTFEIVINPAFRNDVIKTGFTSKTEAEEFLKLNTLVTQVIEGALIHQKPFHSLKRKYYSLSDLYTTYSKTTVIPAGKTVITGGVFGGDYLK